MGGWVVSSAVSRARTGLPHFAEVTDQQIGDQARDRQEKCLRGAGHAHIGGGQSK